MNAGDLKTISGRLGSAIRAQRKAVRLSQEEAAWRSGIDLSCLNRIERGLGNPCVTTITQIAAALQTTTAQLLHGIDAT